MKQGIIFSVDGTKWKKRSAGVDVLNFHRANYPSYLRSSRSNVNQRRCVPPDHDRGNRIPLPLPHRHSCRLVSSSSSSFPCFPAVAVPLRSTGRPLKIHACRSLPLQLTRVTDYVRIFLPVRLEDNVPPFERGKHGLSFSGYITDTVTLLLEIRAFDTTMRFVVLHSAFALFDADDNDEDDDDDDEEEDDDNDNDDDTTRRSPLTRISFFSSKLSSFGFTSSNAFVTSAFRSLDNAPSLSSSRSVFTRDKS